MVGDTRAVADATGAADTFVGRAEDDAPGRVALRAALDVVLTRDVRDVVDD